MCFKINNYLILLIYCYIINKTFRLWGDNVIILILDKKEAENINKIYTQYSKFMFAVAYNILNNVHNSEDAIQQALIKIIENINKIDDIKSKRTRNYIGLSVRNIAINM